MHLFGHLEFTGFGVKSSVLRVSVGPSSSVMLWRSLSIVYVCIHLYGGCPQIRGIFVWGRSPYQGLKNCWGLCWGPLFRETVIYTTSTAASQYFKLTSSTATKTAPLK